MPTTVSQEELDSLVAAIRSHRERTGETVNSLASRAGVPPSILSRIIQGTYESSPSLDRVAALCRAIGKRIAIIDAN